MMCAAVDEEGFANAGRAHMQTLKCKSPCKNVSYICMLTNNFAFNCGLFIVGECGSVSGHP